jgi:hypothetical protein
LFKGLPRYPAASAGNVAALEGIETSDRPHGIFVTAHGLEHLSLIHPKVRISPGDERYLEMLCPPRPHPCQGKGERRRRLVTLDGAERIAAGGAQGPVLAPLPWQFIEEPRLARDHVGQIHLWQGGSRQTWEECNLQTGNPRDRYHHSDD